VRFRQRLSKNRYGFGIQRAEALMKENGNPPLEFDIDDKVFGVTLRRGRA
jgi:ATP-dependent DNA helicase RecG